MKYSFAVLYLLIFTVLTHSAHGQVFFGEEEVLYEAEFLNTEVVLTEDINGDGQIDIVVFDKTKNKLFYKENLGNSSFEPAAVVSDESNWTAGRRYNLMDIDDDGDMDIIRCSPSVGQIHWFENLGGAFFANPELFFNVSYDDEFYEIIDMDGDGDYDVRFANNHWGNNQQNPEIGFYRNDGNVNFNERIRIAANNAYNAFYTSALDLDGDGDVDFVRGVFNEIVWFENDGNENFSSAQNILADIRIAEYLLTSFDMDMDGDEDLFFLADDDTSLYVLENIGLGNFMPERKLMHFSIFSQNDKLKFLDSDKDGDIDLLYKSRSANTQISYFENQGNWNLAQQKTYADLTHGFNHFHLKDFDNDSNLDILITATNQEFISLFTNTGQNNFVRKRTVSDVLGDVNNVISADINNDGAVDLVALSVATSSLVWLENGKNVPKIIDLKIASPSSICLADLNSDGNVDVVIGNSSNPTLGWYPNDGNGNFAPFQAIDSDNSRYSILSSGDFNKDGNIDLLSYNPGSDNKIYWYENQNEGSNFIKKELFSEFGALQSIRNISIEDVTGNGFLDIVFEEDNNIFGGNSMLRCIENSGQGFLPVKELIFGSIVGDYALSDIDNDGDQDVAIARLEGGLTSTTSVMQVFKNNGYFPLDSLNRVSFEDVDSLVPSISEMFSVDIDNDNDEDLLLMSSNLGVIYFSENKDSGLFSADNTYRLPVNLNRYFKTNLVDVDNDNDFDLIRASTNMGRISRFLNEKERISVIAGRVFLDQNENNIFDAEDIGLKTSIDHKESNHVFYTNSSGSYKIFVENPSGTHTLEVMTPKIYNCENKGFLNVDNGQPNNGVVQFDNIDKDVNQDFTFIDLENEICSSLSGYVYFDRNENGEKDAGEKGINGVKVFAIGTRQMVYTDALGYYEFKFSEDKVEKIGIEYDDLSSSCGGYYVSTVPAKNVLYTVSTTSERRDLNFGLNEVEGYETGLYSLRVQQGNIAGSTFTAWMDYKSCGNNVETCTLRIDHDPFVTLLNSSRNPSIVGTSFVEWHFGPGTTPSFDCMRMNWKISEDVPDNYLLRWEANYGCPPYIDPTPSNNNLIREVRVQNNSRLSSNSDCALYSLAAIGDMPEVLPSSDVRLSYVVTFHNSSIDTVHDLIIVDTLPEELNGKSVAKPFGSAPSDFSIIDSSILIWQFSDLNIPPSEIDELNSYGFVQFNVSLNDGLPGGTEIVNKAHVIFNNGNTEATNEVLHRLDIASGFLSQSKKQRISIYPNPANEVITVDLREMDQKSQYSIQITNTAGKKIFASNKIQTIGEVDVTSWAKGVYFITICGENNDFVEIQKFVKM